nr:hypothetical protein 7 [Desulfobulbaceae bacterium]
MEITRNPDLTQEQKEAVEVMIRIAAQLPAEVMVSTLVGLARVKKWKGSEPSKYRGLSEAITIAADQLRGTVDLTNCVYQFKAIDQFFQHVAEN